MKFRLYKSLLFKLILIFLLHGFVAKAQFDTQLSQYMLAPGTYNPAVAGSSNEMVATVQSRQQWIGVENGGNTLLANVSTPLNGNKVKQGLGLLIGKESIGLFSTQQLQIQYAYRKPIRWGMLSLGLQGGILQQGFDASGIYIPENSDYHTSTETNMPTGSLEGIAPDFSAGIWLDAAKWHLGFSASHLLGSTIRLKVKGAESASNDPTFVPSRTYYLTHGYNIVLANPFYTLQPTLLLKTDLTAWQMDLSARILYKEKFWGGLGWRYQDAIVLMAGVKLQRGLSIGYSYDVSTSAVARFSSGSHELFMSYTKKINTATVSKKQKSVRIL
jgi:type IX secretion system PorP/SprF family membrane protein